MRRTPDPVCRAILIVVLVTCIAVCGCTGSGPSTTTTPTQVPGATTVNIQNFAFNPASITVPKGTTVIWVNQDTADHQIINDAQGSIGEGTLFTSNSLQKGAQYPFRFDTPGTYPYHCNIHPSMKATVIVT
jgi:plastocyanin